MPAICCTWISNRWHASSGWGIASTGINRRNAAASATNMPTSRLTMRRASRLSKSGGHSAGGPVRPFCGTPSSGFAAAASPSVGSSRTMAPAISRAVSPACVGPGRCDIASPGRTPRVPTARPSASSKRCYGSGPTGAPLSARCAGPPPSSRIYGSITTDGHMRVWVAARPGCVSKRLPKDEQPL